MADETCACDGSAAQLSEGDTVAGDRWIDERPVTEGALPDDMARRMTRFYSADAVETLGDFVSATRADAGGAIAAEQLCHVDGDSPHVASTPAETYRFRCFFDGVALSLLADEPVTIVTESPAGHPIEVRATPDGAVESTPPDAAVSFGIAADVGPFGEDGPDLGAVYGAVCPYVKAFRTREAYEGWAAAVDAATVGLPLDAGMTIARGLTEAA